MVQTQSCRIQSEAAQALAEWKAFFCRTGCHAGERTGEKQ